MRRSAWLRAIWAVSLLLVVASLWAMTSRPARDVGSLAPLRSASYRVAGTSEQANGLVVPDLKVGSALLSRQPRARRGEVPTRLRIDAIDVDAAVLPVGVTDGTTEVPFDVHDVGWYRFGARPGERGSTLLLAHVSSGTQGAGVFYRLRELQPGDEVTVGARDGGSSAYRVIARRSYPKEGLPGRVFSRSGPAVLTLVTCGGRFLEETGRYADNVVVYAVG